jgi:hypothetical protein
LRSRFSSSSSFKREGEVKAFGWSAAFGKICCWGYPHAFIMPRGALPAVVLLKERDAVRSASRLFNAIRSVRATDAVDGLLNGKRYLIHDRDPLFTAEFLSMLAETDRKGSVKARR